MVFFGIAIITQIKDHNKQNRQERAEEDRKYNEQILKNRLAYKIESTGFRIDEDKKQICFNYDEEFVNLVKELKGKNNV